MPKKIKVVTIITFMLMIGFAASLQAATRYSVNNGNWNSTGTWSATSGGSSGASVPIAGDNVYIERDYDVTVTAAAACASITFPTTSTTNNLNINTGITLTVSGTITIPRAGGFGTTYINTVAVGAGTLNAANIAFTDAGGSVRHRITISTGTVTVSGDVTNSPSGSGDDSPTITFTGAGLLRLGGTIFSSSYGVLTTFTGSRVEYNRAGAQTVQNFSYYHLTLSGSGTKTMPGTSMTISGNFTMSGTCSATAGNVLIVNGNFTIGSNNTFTAGNYSHQLKGNWSNSGTFTAGTSTFTLNGTSNQTMSGSTFNNLTINNAAGVTLLSDETVNGTLTLTNGIVTTGSYQMIMGNSGSVSRGNGHINGNLRKYVSTGSGVSRTFEIGDASSYSPVNVQFASVSAANNLIAKATAGEHPNINTSKIKSSKSVNRYWTLTNGGVTYTNYSATFTFVPGDIDGGANTSNFIVGKRDASVWTYPTVGTRTATTTQATGMTSMSEFAIGEESSATIVATAYGSGNIIPSGTISVSYGSDTTFTITPYIGYNLDSLKVDGVNHGDDSTSYKFTNVSTDHTIDAYFCLPDTILNEGFEQASFPPAGWDTINALGPKRWALSTTRAHSGTRSAKSPNEASGGNMDWLITPRIGPIDASDSLSLWTMQHVNIIWESLYVRVSTNATQRDTSQYSYLGLIVINTETDVWSRHAFSLGAYAGQQIYIAFYDVGGYPQDTIHIDDVVVQGCHPTTIDTFSITAATYGNGTVLPAGVTWVSYNGSQAYTIAANTGHHIDSVLVDGVSQGVITNYPFNSVTANHTIDGYFSPDTFSITAATYGNGTVLPAGVTWVSYNGSQAYTIAANTGHHIDSVLVDGVSQGVITNYPFNSVTANHTIDGYFSPDEEYHDVGIVSIPQPGASVPVCTPFNPIVEVYNYSTPSMVEHCTVDIYIWRYPVKIDSFCHISVNTAESILVYSGSVAVNVNTGSNNVQFPSWHPTWSDLTWLGNPTYHVIHSSVRMTSDENPNNNNYQKQFNVRSINNDLQVNGAALMRGSTVVNEDTIRTGTSYNTMSVVSNNSPAGRLVFRSWLKIIRVKTNLIVYSRYLDRTLNPTTYACLAYSSGWVPQDTGWYKISTWIEMRPGVDVTPENNSFARYYYATYLTSGPSDNIQGEATSPETYALFRNYPNPFADMTQIRWQIPVPTRVTISIYDATGRVVKTLISGEHSAGVYTSVWNCTNNRGQKVASGIYFYEMRTDKYTSRQKLVIR